MTLEVGKRLGPYEIEAPAGKGGMGEIFRAKDTRLDRTVAIKVLPENMAVNADLKARFEREAKAISSLNHPNICTLHDIGNADGVDFLVMEFLEGETLAERIKKGPIELEEIYEIATEVCDALDKAHSKGLIHRDLKPGNIMLTSEGAKLLDFGLAKLKLTDAQGNEISQITQTTPLTGTGTILGTLQYMAPEQLEGADADARSDIFAFGEVLYEMLTGRKAFDGKSQASLIAAIIGQDPIAVSEIKPMTPPGLSRLVKKCIEKEPDKRWQSVRDLADELRWISRSGSQAGIPAPVSSHRRIRMRVGWTVAAVTSIAALVLGGMMFFSKEPHPMVAKFEIVPDQGMDNIVWPTISPDGTMIAFRGVDTTGRLGLYVRPINSLEAYRLQGTERSGHPFWSPDSKYLAYFVDDQLMKMPVSGGPAQLVCEASGSDGSWGRSGVILFDGAAGDSIRQVSSAGGVATAATIIDHAHGETSHAWPWFLPDGEHFLYTARSDSSSGGAWGNLILKVGSISDNNDKIIGNVGTLIEYGPKSDQVLFVRNGTLLAQKFDPGKLEFVGEPVPVAQNVSVVSSQRAHFWVSDNGVLIYQVGSVTARSELDWVDRSGKVLERINDQMNYYNPALSPDESRLVYAVRDSDAGQKDLWIRDLKRNVSTRLTFDPGDDDWAKWSPDGSRIYYSNTSGGVTRIMEISASGMTEPRVVIEPKTGNYYPSAITADMQTLYFDAWESGTADIWKLNLSDSGSAEKVASKPYRERRIRLSPDNKYALYVSDESGEYEVYLLRLTDGGGRWQVSTGGGIDQEWGPGGREIYFLTPTSDLVSVPVNITGNQPEIGQPDTLFNRQWNFDVSHDGTRFIFASPLGDRQKNRFTVVLNWDQELEQE